VSPYLWGMVLTCSMPLKRELGVTDWYAVIKEIRAIVETDNGEQLHE
jgi:hypothetical protein